jgi:hypothetical protein
MRLEVQKTKLLKTTGRVFKFSIRNGIIWSQLEEISNTEDI